MAIHQIFLYLVLFIGGGIFGWLADTTYRSLIAGRYAPSTLVPFFSLIFGTAAIMLYTFFRSHIVSFPLSVIFGTMLCVGLELISAVLLQLVFHYRLWDYSANPFNFYGFIDLQHTLYWFFLTFLYRLFYELLN